jgi:type I restriction-modification system DNA methylase subunit
VYLYGKEINDETYAICKSDMMIKGNDPKNIRPGSTLSTDEFASNRFDFMLSNPPYGKSWASEQNLSRMARLSLIPGSRSFSKITGIRGSQWMLFRAPATVSFCF